MWLKVNIDVNRPRFQDIFDANHIDSIEGNVKYHFVADDISEPPEKTQQKQLYFSKPATY